LRLRDAAENEVERSRWRESLSELSGLPLPSLDDEVRDPRRADDTYAAMTASARERTRSRDRFGLLFEENRNYGFQRNLLGVQPLGVVMGALGLAACLVLLGVQVLSEPAEVAVGAVLGALINAVLVALWWATPSRYRVREAAEKYARQLMISTTEGRYSS
jgi:hypothetical protein